MKKTITLIRHAQSLFNAGQYTSQEEIRNCKITDLGKVQCKNLTQSFDVIIISPLKRAMETYTYSNIKTGKVIVNDLFREYKELNPIPLNFLDLEEPIPETIDQVKTRANDAIEYLKSLPYNNIGVISHGIFMNHLFECVGLPQKLLHNTEACSFYFP